MLSENKLTPSIKNLLERIEYTQSLCLMYKLGTNGKDSIFLSHGFDETNKKRKKDQTDEKKLQMLLFFLSEFT